MVDNAVYRNVFIGINFINNTLLIGYSSRPTTAVLMFQCLRLANSAERVLADAVHQFNDAFKNFGMFFCPFVQMLRSLHLNNDVAHGSLTKFFVYASNSSHVNEITFPASTSFTDCSSRAKYSSLVFFGGKTEALSSIEILTAASDLFLRYDLMRSNVSYVKSSPLNSMVVLIQIVLFSTCSSIISKLIL